MAPPKEPPLLHHLTLDTLTLILSRSLFHPFITLLIPLSLRACAKPYTAPSMQAAILWAGLVITYHILSAINSRIAYGPPRELDWEEEVVVVTGGSSGLGKVLAQMYGMRGASVAVLDINVPGEEERREGEGLEGVRFYGCDVSVLEEVQRAKDQIEQDLGTPTILINNAAAPIHAGPLHTRTPAQYTSTLNINLLSHFHTLHTFLPGLLSPSVPGGTIVTISSVLGKLGAANLTPYTASKAALLALHSSLSAEYPPRSTNLRTILVTPGQLGTTLFAGMTNLPWYAHFLGPVVEPVELAREIVRKIDDGTSGEISLPVYASWIEWVFVLPKSVQRVVRWIAGIDSAMEAGGGPGEGKKEK